MLTGSGAKYLSLVKCPHSLQAICEEKLFSMNVIEPGKNDSFLFTIAMPLCATESLFKAAKTQKNPMPQERNNALTAYCERRSKVHSDSVCCTHFWH
jgi:hypothetical protein